MTNPNPNHLYTEDKRWCGMCGEPRKANKKNRCPDCGCILRSKKH